MTNQHDSYRKYAQNIRPKSNYSATKYHNYSYSLEGKENTSKDVFDYASRMNFVQYKHHPNREYCAQECPTALKKKSKKMHCHCKCKNQ